MRRVHVAHLLWSTTLTRHGWRSPFEDTSTMTTFTSKLHKPIKSLVTRIFQPQTKPNHTKQQIIKPNPPIQTTQIKKKKGWAKKYADDNVARVFSANSTCCFDHIIIKGSIQSDDKRIVK